MCTFHALDKGPGTSWVFEPWMFYAALVILGCGFVNPESLRV